MSDAYLSVVIPAYNEEKRVSASIEEIAGYLARQDYACEIIAVNDGSTDRTLEILRELEARFPQMRVITYSENRGKGYAVRQGVMAAKGEFVLFSDADLNTPIGDVEKLFAALDAGVDIAIGSRAAPGAKIAAHRPWLREVGSRGLNLAIRLLAVPGVRDTQCGFKLFKARAAQDIFERAFIDRFSFDIEILYLARKLGYRTAEVPVIWFYRGGSKVRPFVDGLRFLKDIARIRLHRYHLETTPETVS